MGGFCNELEFRQVIPLESLRETLCLVRFGRWPLIYWHSQRLPHFIHPYFCQRHALLALLLSLLRFRGCVLACYLLTLNLRACRASRTLMPRLGTNSPDFIRSQRRNRKLISS